MHVLERTPFYTPFSVCQMAMHARSDIWQVLLYSFPKLHRHSLSLWTLVLFVLVDLGGMLPIPSSGPTPGFQSLLDTTAQAHGDLCNP